MSQTHNKQTQVSKNTITSIEQLNEKELELIFWLRTRFRYGEVTIEVRDGIPYRIVKAYETQQL